MELRRLLAGGAAAWVTLFVVLYLIAIASQNGSPAWWFVGVLAVVVAGLVLFVRGTLGPQALAAATVVLVVLFVLSIFSIGFLLLPALVATVTALFTRRRFELPPDPD